MSSCYWLLLVVGALGVFGAAQENSDKAPSDEVAVFKAQTSLVLVDAIVTDKQGKYVKELSADDFRVWEDGKEQVIRSFSSEASADATRQQYLVMLFDDANSSFDEQARARKAALQLAGTPVRSELEKAAAGEKSQTVDASMGVAYFFESTNTARVSLAMEIPPGSIKLTKEKGKMRGSVEVLGTALNGDQSVAARFSDRALIELDDDKELQQFNTTPYHYEKQFEIASGKYQLKVAFRSGDDAFGRFEVPLTVEAFDAAGFNVSAIAFSTETSGISDEAEMLERELMQDRMSLVSHGVQYVPSGSSRFQKASSVFLYFEIYEPLLMEKTRPRVGVQYVVIDATTKAVVLDTGLMELDALMETNNPVIAVGLKLPVQSLREGRYHLELRALDSANRSQIRTAEFEVR